MNGHKVTSDYAAGKINKISFYMMFESAMTDYIHVCIVDMIHVGNNTESQLEELLSRKERKWIRELGSISNNGLCQDDGFYCQNKRCRNR